MTAITRMQQKRGTGAQWAEANTILADGEVGVESDADPVRFKLGNGATAWNDLPYYVSAASDPDVTIPPISTMYFDDERDDAEWTWATSGGDPTLAIAPVLHFAHRGSHETAFTAGGLDGNTPAFLYPGVLEDSSSDSGLYHVEALIMGQSLYPSTGGKFMTVTWHMGLRPVGTGVPLLDSMDWDIRDSVPLIGDEWTSRLSGDVILDQDHSTYGFIRSPTLHLADADERGGLTVKKVIITARRLCAWSFAP